MLRRLSTRSLIAATLALAAGAGCGTVRGWLPWHRHAAPDDIAAPRTDAEATQRRQARERLREDRDRAWAAVARGGSPRGFDRDDALALSEAARRVDVAASWEHPPATTRATLADLPRAHWWHLFVPPSAWAKGPLALDRDHAPGTYAAMMDALEHVVALGRAAAPLDADAYLELHRQATLGVFDRERGALHPGFAHAPNRYPVAALHDPSSLHVEHLAAALAELKAEGVAGWSPDVQRDRGDETPPAWLVRAIGAAADLNPASKPAKLVYVRGPRGHAFEHWLVGMNAFSEHEARAWVAQWLADYAIEQQQAPRRTPEEFLDLLASQPIPDDAALAARPSARPSEDLLASVRPIARLLRRLQVTHAFDDRADVLHVGLVLQRLLASAGLPPAILDDPSRFDGREPLDVLCVEILRGQLRFQGLVRELAARELDPGTGATPLRPSGGPTAITPIAPPLAISPAER